MVHMFDHVCCDTSIKVVEVISQIIVYDLYYDDIVFLIIVELIALKCKLISLVHFNVLSRLQARAQVAS